MDSDFNSSDLIVEQVVIRIAARFSGLLYLCPMHQIKGLFSQLHTCCTISARMGAVKTAGRASCSELSPSRL